MSLRTALFSLAVMAGSALGAPAKLTTRQIIDHDAVASFSETVPDSAAGKLITKYAPHLRIANGCVPFPAVDSMGNIGDGLKPTGNMAGDCSSSQGQMYARAATYKDRFAIMYSWYMPKTEPSALLGHRHNWNNAVVWLTDDSDKATLVGTSISQKSSYDQSTTPALDGDAPLFYYKSKWPTVHELYYDSLEGQQESIRVVDVPLVAWDSLPTASQEALATADFGDEVVPFIDTHFNDKLGAAYEA
ncbi:hypothetical protein Daus18300_008290 [Diaporthe australafricana]|uniref:Uncharacterized protein n=1 Tax=Diaporthe australafricana TaxID=127596 RepID=A0ABR3WJG6_9PEZI